MSGHVRTLRKDRQHRFLSAIVFYKSFVIGDFIFAGEYMGTIDHIGLNTTRIRSLSGEQLVFANGAPLIGRIRNFKPMDQRGNGFANATQMIYYIEKPPAGVFPDHSPDTHEPSFATGAAHDSP